MPGRRPRLAQLGATDQARDAFRAGASIAALAREHGVSRGAIRTAAMLDTDGATSADRKAYRIYTDRLTAAAARAPGQ